MRAFNILERYIGKVIFTTIMMTIVILISLSSIIKFADQLKKVGQGNYNVIDAGIYTLLNIPKDIQIFFPMSSLVGSILGLGIMIQYRELMVMQVSGFSCIQIILSVIKISIPLVLLIVVVDEWIAPHGEQMAHNYRTKAIYGNSILTTQHGIWAKDKDSFIYIEHIEGINKLIGVNIYKFDTNRRLQSIYYASSAKFSKDRNLWYLSQVEKCSLQDPKQIDSSKIVSTTWKTNLTPEKLSVIVLGPDALSVVNLYKYVKYLKSNGQEFQRYQLNMWSKIFHPLSVIVMMLMALSFIFGPFCSVQMGIRMIIGISFSFLFYVLERIFEPLIFIYGIPPIISALLPTVIFFSISLWLLLKYS